MKDNYSIQYWRHYRGATISVREYEEMPDPDLYTFRRRDNVNLAIKPKMNERTA